MSKIRTKKQFVSFLSPKLINIILLFYYFPQEAHFELKFSLIRPFHCFFSLYLIEACLHHPQIPQVVVGIFTRISSLGFHTCSLLKDLVLRLLYDQFQVKFRSAFCKNTKIKMIKKYGLCTPKIQSYPPIIQAYPKDPKIP